MRNNDYDVVWLKSVSLLTWVKTKAYDNPSCQPFRFSETRRHQLDAWIDKIKFRGMNETFHLSSTSYIVFFVEWISRKIVLCSSVSC